jgi:hypothetical protein
LKILRSNAGKALIWFVGNAVFGLMPLLIMEFLASIAPKSGAVSEIAVLMKSGIVLFVACTMMGSVVIDILNDGIDLRGFSYFALTVSPFMVLFLQIIAYILVVCKVLAENQFKTDSWMNIIIFIFAVPYCLLAKYYLYKSGGLKNG